MPFYWVLTQKTPERGVGIVSLQSSLTDAIELASTKTKQGTPCKVENHLHEIQWPPRLKNGTESREEV